MNNNKILSAANDFLSNNQGVTAIVITKNNNTLISLDMDNGNSSHYEALVSAFQALAASTNSTNVSQGGISTPSVNMYQPKYKLETVANILDVSKQTLSNWGKGNKLTVYKEKGKSTFVLEQDLLKKYLELHGVELPIDEDFRSRYQYL